MERNIEYAARWSLLGSIAIVWCIAILTGSIKLVGQETWLLVSGNVDQIVKNDSTFLQMLANIFGVVSIDLIFSGLSIALVIWLVGNVKDHAITNKFKVLKARAFFFKFFILVIIEELFARALFLGLLTKIPAFSGKTAFYVLFFIGNATWALIHLRNYQREDRKIIRVLPQFLGGIFFTYIYVKYGLFASILTHFASNAVIFSVMKKQEVDQEYIYKTVYNLILVIACYMLMRQPISDIMVWFAEEPQFVISGWKFQDYLFAFIFLESAVRFVFSFLLYDDPGFEGKKEISDKELRAGLALTLAVPPILVAMVFGVYYLAGFATDYVPVRILIACILMAFLNKNVSGSAIARTFWAQLIGFYFIVCVVQALGFWMSVLLMVFYVLSSLPYIVIAYIYRR